MDFVTQPNPRQFSLSSIREMFNHTTATGKSGIAATEVSSAVILYSDCFADSSCLHGVEGKSNQHTNR